MFVWALRARKSLIAAGRRGTQHERLMENFALDDDDDVFDVCVRSQVAAAATFSGSFFE